MRETTSEIKKVFDKHQYTIDSIVFDVMQTFKLNSIIRHTQFEKHEGYAVTEVLALLIMCPLMMFAMSPPLTSSISILYSTRLFFLSGLKMEAFACRSI